jgi:hypothetical protein
VVGGTVVVGLGFDVVVVGFGLGLAVVVVTAAFTTTLAAALVVGGASEVDSAVVVGGAWVVDVVVTGLALAASKALMWALDRLARGGKEARASPASAVSGEPATTRLLPGTESLTTARDTSGTNTIAAHRAAPGSQRVSRARNRLRTRPLHFTWAEVGLGGH